MDLWMKRDDMLHPQVSGNKFRKLKYPLQALQGQSTHVVSMGGIWSNHIHALAHAVHALGLPATALIRGASGMHSAMLDDVVALGMQVQFVNREAYRQLRADDTAWRSHVVVPDERTLWLPEGGSAPLALRGVAELVAELPFIPDYLVLACGTGATLAGVLAGLGGRSRVLGIAAISHGDYLRADISRLLDQAGYPDYQNYELLTGYHHGGYGKVSAGLTDFCHEFQQETAIPLEPVYTGKMMYALRQLWHDGYLAQNARVVAVHTGGLQGARGFARR
ncbi:1-aminocyclopropane-1-carboxylate deaminase/D-cysteine desulfhydrase [Undibacterium sp. YM2]|uniref:1-aminocyclopropane-1-carboxylate deaminase/D-cysteine desulfhydrase n=1 Tax=Undibacterium sp. YM2 TaxID=2058625 RepID=UPI0021059AA0|nr:pyridoxal-phosphate dependent enzyme [Undibacterium sp. YM2]